MGGASTNAFGGATNPPAASTSSVFGAPAPATTSVFGAPAPATTSVFGAPAPAPTTSVFGQPSAPSAFGAAGPNNAFGQSQSQQQQPSSISAFGSTPSGLPPKPVVAATASTQKKGPDFERAVYNYRPGLIPHDKNLPPNYAEVLPEKMMVAFKAMKFEWGNVPVWVPPVEVRTKNVGQALFS